MAYTCDGPHPDPVQADMLITQLSDGDTQTLCQQCYLESCIRVAAAIADAMAAQQAESPTPFPVGATARNVGAAENRAPAKPYEADPAFDEEYANQELRAPGTAATGKENEGAAQEPPRPKSGRRARERAQTAPEEGGEEDSALQGAEHDG